VQSTGDGIFALFGAPLAHEDHPQRALYAALRMQEEMRRYGDRMRAQGQTPIQVRIGINTGEVVVRSIQTSAGHTEYTPIGHSTSLAARLQTLATPGSTVIISTFPSNDDERKRREKVAGKIVMLDHALEDTIPYVFALPGMVQGGNPVAQMDAQIKKRRTLEAIKRIILRESLNQPLMVIFEDLHWIDEQTQEFLNVLADSIGTAKIVAVLGKEFTLGLVQLLTQHPHPRVTALAEQDASTAPLALSREAGEGPSDSIY